MNKIVKLLLFVLIILSVVYIYALITREKQIEKKGTYIDKETAIELAQTYCAEIHSSPQEEPRNIEAKLIKCSEVDQQAGWKACDLREHSPDLLIWYVSMDGLWFHWGPLDKDGTNVPIPIKECKVIMDAKTGDTRLE